MRLFDYKGEAAIELMADLFDPAMAILGKPEVKKAFQDSSVPLLGKAKAMMKYASHETLEIMAMIDGTPVEEFKPTIPEIMKRLLDMLSNPEFMSLFTSQGQNTEGDTSGSATESTEA